VTTNTYDHERKKPATGPTEPYPQETRRLDGEMATYLYARHLSYTCARSNGWFPTDQLDEYPRIVVPATNLAGQRFWQARVMSSSPEAKRWKSASGARNNSIVVCWPFHLHPQMKVIVVEGPMDALAAATAHHVGLAAMGKQSVGDVLTYVVHQADNIFHGLGVVVVPDLDSVEFGARAVGELAFAGIKAEIRLPPYEDLAALTKVERRALLR